MRQFAAALACAALGSAGLLDARDAVADRVMTLTRASTWMRAASVPIAFRTFHPQGMVRIGETLQATEVFRAYFMSEDDRSTLYIYDVR